jgi:hypothetical protein
MHKLTTIIHHRIQYNSVRWGYLLSTRRMKGVLAVRYLDNTRPFNPSTWDFLAIRHASPDYTSTICLNNRLLDL